MEAGRDLASHPRPLELYSVAPLCIHRDPLAAYLPAIYNKTVVQGLVEVVELNCITPSHRIEKKSTLRSYLLPLVTTKTHKI